MGIFMEGHRNNDADGGDPTAQVPTQQNPYSNESGARDPYGQMTYGGKAAVQRTGPDGKLLPIEESSGQQAADAYDKAGAAATTRPGVQLSYGTANQTLGGSKAMLGGSVGLVGQGTQATDRATSNLNQAGEARDAQREALDLQRSAAVGAQPSAAEIQGQNMLNQGLQGQLAGAASARGGPLAQMTAQGQVQRGAAAFQQQGTNQLAAMRANEMAGARDAYQTGAGAIRGQDFTGANTAIAQGQGYGNLAGQTTAAANAATDIGKTEAGMATTQGQADIDQRHLNQNESQFQQGLGHDVREAEAQRGVTATELADKRFTQQSDKHQHEVDRDTGTVASIAGGVGSLLGALSDMRAKIPVSMGDGAAVGKNVGAGIQRARGQTSGQPGQSAPQGSRQQGNMEEMRKIQSSFGEKDDATKQWERSNGDSSKVTAGARDQPMAKPQGKGAEWLDRYMSGQPQNTTAEPFNSGEIERDDPYSNGTPGGVQRQDPYGGQYNPLTQQKDPSSAAMFFSDEHTKQQVELDAFRRGAQFATPGGAGHGDQSLLPDSMGDEPGNTGRPAGDGVMGKAGESIGHTRHIVAQERADRSEARKDRRTPRTASFTSQRSDRGSWGTSSAIVEGPETASAIAPGAHGDGISVPQSQGPMPEWADPRRYDYGGSPTAQGRELPGTPQGPRPKDPYGPGGGAGALQYSDNKTKDAKLGGTDESMQQDANRRGAGFGYAYKGQFTPGDQESGELNYGPSANELEKNPLTATAIKRDPKTGMRMVDGSKLLKTNTAGIADLQKQIDEMRNGSH
jgi:hypothetical protein